MENRTTIKVSKETKAKFDIIHKDLQLKNHDVTLELIMNKEKDQFHLKSEVKYLRRELSRNKTTDEILKKFIRCSEMNPVISQGVQDGISDKEIIFNLCEYISDMNMRTLHMMSEYNIVEREIDETIKGLYTTIEAAHKEKADD